MDEILSQEEINALLSSFAKQEVERAAKSGNGKKKQVRPYDFRRPDKLSKEQLRTIEMIHETFARLLTTWMSTYLRLPVRVTLTSSEQMSFDEFSSSLPIPGVIAVFNISPPDGEAILSLEPLLAFGMLDRVLGGPGQAKGKPRELTDIEQRLMQDLTAKVLDLLTRAWSDVTAFSARLENIVASPQFAQITAETETVGTVSLQVTLGEITGGVTLCYPYPVLQPVLPRLVATRWFKKQTGRGAEASSAEAIRQRLANVQVPVTVELGQATVLVGDFLDLAVGDIIKLDSRRGEDLVVRVGGGAKFVARPGVIGKRLAFQVSRVLYDRGGTLR
ncbi:MAG: flagellar motor switch protein FliM [Firmicutes bacterium]|nr:flagellar motor switch protein FliM [Bacillota bacterium]MDH7495388.1 flagellar motor switch protein FliM [Bacillota bacterium]